MNTYQIQFKDTDMERIRLLLEFVKSLDFVQSVQPIFKKVSESKRKGEPGNGQAEGFLTLQEIKSRYPNEWVLLGDAVKNGLEIKGGKVLAHDPNKRAWALKGREIIQQHSLKQVAHCYTGELPKHAHSGLLKKVSHYHQL
ncbi:MAG: hypothetical protein AAB316_04615 [Bacteroidota bacterium]